MGSSILPIESPGSGLRSRTRAGGVSKSLSSSACSRSVWKAEIGSCHASVTPASAISSTPLTIITEATKCRTTRTGPFLRA